MATKWKLFEKSGGRSGKYEKYRDRVVIITTNKGLIFTPATIKLLGDPDRVLLLHDGSNRMGIRPVKEDDPLWGTGFSVQKPDRISKGVKVSKGSSFINCAVFLKKYDLNPKMVFSTISIENDILVVDLDKYEILRVQN